MGFIAIGGEHFLGRHGGTGVSVVRQALLGIVDAPKTRSGERRQALSHTGDLLVVRGVQIVHRSQPSVIPHEGEAAADIARYPLVGMMVVVVMMMGELVRYGGYGWQGLQRGEGGVGAAHTHARWGVTRHGHGGVQCPR